MGDFSHMGGELSHCPDCGQYLSPGWGRQGRDNCTVCGYYPGRTPGISEIFDSGAEPVSGVPASISPGSSGVVHRSLGVTWGGKQIIAGIILVIFLLFFAAAAASLLGSLYPEQEDAVGTWISVHLMALAIAATVWFLGLRHTRYPLAVLRLSRIRFPRKRTVLLMFGVLATCLIATSFYSGIVAWLDVEILSPPEIESDIIFDGPAAILTFQALAFVTPLSEEIFFRGFIFGGLLPRLGPWRAIVVSALVFSAFHFSLGLLIPIFITGFLLAWLYWRTGSLWAAIGAHAGQNALALGVQAFGS